MDTKALRQKILDLAIRGKLVPQDPNDEPASVLLERIRAEKQQMVKDGKLKAKDIKNDTVIFKGDDNLHYEKYGESLPNGWVVTNFGTLLSYEQPTKYIVNDTDYKPTYKTPVLTAGKSFILGYTNETDNIFDDLPVIIFDDFTTESKFVDFPFKVKSSAMKILHINQDLVLPKYAFYLMQATEIDHENHQRYWISTYSQEIISLPPLSEQIKIIEAVENLFDLTQSVETNSQNLKNSIKTTKSKILDLAIRGKLVPQDPNDEPASVLLERIRAEKEELIKQGKIKRDKKESVIFKGDDNSYYEKYGEKLPSGWVVTNFETILEYEQPTKYIVHDTNYKPTYKTPVLTAGKSFILGYTNETDNIFDDLPVIILDDFTTESKFVDFPFKVKSSAMKILHINQDLVLPKYAFYLMQATEIDHDNHQRYWISTYSQEIVALPPVNEQERILTALEHYFNLFDTLQ
ncbi:hypothetical protein MR988_00140 [bacterium]|nr:hypothetical protein [bacterium]